MPKLTIQGKTFEVEAGTRLVLAIEQTGVDIGHRCGGNARMVGRAGELEGRWVRFTEYSSRVAQGGTLFQSAAVGYQGAVRSLLSTRSAPVNTAIFPTSECGTTTQKCHKQLLKSSI